MSKLSLFNIQVNELIQFLRIEICLFITGISLTGYLLFNEITVTIFYVVFSTFCITASVYAYNLITDKKEDLMNNKKLNLYVINNKGIYFVYLFAFLGLISSYFISSLSFKATIFLIVTGFFYSFYRIKEIFPLKNIYTGFIITLVFFVGSCANNILSESMCLHYFVLSSYIFTISLTSDLRDYNGDRLTGIKTIPVVLGYNSSKIIIYFILLSFILFIIYKDMSNLFTLVPFSLIGLIYVYLNLPKISHKILMFSFIILPIVIITLQ